MRIIVQGNKDYLKLFPTQTKAEKTQYVFSPYLLEQDTAEGKLLLSTLTGELVLLAPEDLQKNLLLDSSNSSAVFPLIAHRFLIPEKAPENVFVQALQTLMLKRRNSKKTIRNYTILPTTFCNAHCFYCYENGTPHVHMTEETAEKLVDFIAAHHGKEKVKLSWFGGEPLVGRPRIDQICSSLTKKGIIFESKMTSNGYLFDRDLIHHAKEFWNLTSIQITLDGTEEIYNRTKAYVNAPENPYQRVLRNIDALTDAGIYVKIRLNLDSHNAENLFSLVQELSDRYHQKDYLHVYVSPLNEDAGFEPIEHSKKDLERLAKQLIDLQELLEQKGWLQYGDTKLPSMKITNCIADDPGCVLCTPEGLFGECIGQFYNHTVGSLETSEINRAELNYWQQKQVFEGCVECPLFPSCGHLMMHCPVNRKCTEYEKNRRIARYKEIMLKEYEKWKQSQACPEQT